MTKEQQDLAWKCLSKDIRDEIKRQYNIAIKGNNKWELGVANALCFCFNIFNLTSDAETECDAFIIPVEQVRVTYAYNEQLLKLDPTHKGAQMLQA